MVFGIVPGKIAVALEIVNGGRSRGDGGDGGNHGVIPALSAVSAIVRHGPDGGRRAITPEDPPQADDTDRRIAGELRRRERERRPEPEPAPALPSARLEVQAAKLRDSVHQAEERLAGRLDDVDRTPAAVAGAMKGLRTGFAAKFQSCYPCRRLAGAIRGIPVHSTGERS